MDNLLKIRQYKAIRKVRKLGFDLSKQYGISYNFDLYKSSNISVTRYSNVGYACEVIVGMSSLNKPFGLSIVSDENFAKIVLNMYHEATHVWQKNELFRQTHLDTDTANQLVQEIACMDNHDYYFDNGNYKINSNEIQAEKEGIINAYQYLCDEFPEVNPANHEHIILDIVNDKMLNSTYFVRSEKPFKSLSEIEKAFDDAYDDSFTKKRTYMVNSSNTHDTVKLFMREHPDAKESYLNADSPLDQDRCIAAINLKLHPEWIEAYPSLSDMDLSYENIIEKPYQETQVSRVEKIHSMFGDVLADHRSDNEFEI